MRQDFETDSLRADVAVIGGGMAGMVAANRAAESGAAVVLLEQGEGPDYPCNTRFSTGLFHVHFHDASAPPETLRGALGEIVHAGTSPDLVEVVAVTAGPFLNWMRAEGIRFVKAGMSDWEKWFMAPPRPVAPGLDWKGRGPDQALRRLAENFSRRGGRIVNGFVARELLMSGARCAGVRGLDPSGGSQRDVFAAETIIADGGFQGNPDLVRRFIGPRPEALVQRGAGTGRGAGLLMAEAVGARIADTDRFYGHVLSAAAMSNPMLWPHPQFDEVAKAGLLLGADGRRFANEGLGGVYLANMIAALPDPLAAVLVFDQAIWEGPGRLNRVSPYDHFVRAGGKLKGYDSLRELAADVGLPPQSVEEAVLAYNAAVESNALDQLDPPRTAGDGRYLPFLLKAKPYYALPVTAGITYTMGGIAIDGQCRVLDRSNAVIPGLLAAGASTAGLEGGPGAGYLGGLLKAGVLGMKAGETAAKSAAEIARTA